MFRLTALLCLSLCVVHSLAAQDLPLEPDRHLSIDLTEGTWMSVDVSPDGSTIVFDYLGDLFTIPVQGGDATQLTSGMAWDAQPRYSPDGSQIVFTSDRDGGQNIWIFTPADSTYKQISEGEANRAESPEWMPDGNYVLASIGGFRGGGQPKVKLFHVDGGKGVELVSEPSNLKMLGAAPSPDGSSVWYARRTSDWTYNAQFPQYQLEEFDLDSGEQYARTSRFGSGIRPTLSHDGRHLVYGTRHDDQTGLILRNLETGEERWLAYPVQHDDQESRATLDTLPGMSFTPDGEAVIASYGGGIWRITVAGGDAEQIPFRVRFEMPLAPKVFFDYPIEDTDTFVVQQIRDAVPSPDGSRLAFTAMDRLWTSRADGSNPRRVTEMDESEHFPTWSPDGEWIAYSTWDGDEAMLKKVRADGRGEPVRLTRYAAAHFEPVWAPNGRIVAMRRTMQAFETMNEYGAPGAEIVWVPSEPESRDGSDATVIAPADGRSGAHFTQAGDRIFMRRGDTLLSIRWDGTDEKEHVKVRGPKPEGSDSGLSPSVLKMAPQGDQALALIQWQVYTVTVPRVGSAPTITVPSGAFPGKKVSDVGGEFPAWSADGRRVHWSLGNAHFVYDLEDAQAHADSTAAAGGDEEEDGDADADAEEDADADGYAAVSFRIRIDAPRDSPLGTVVLRGARVITMNADQVIENADLVIENNRIAAVGAFGAVEVPASATIVDVSGKTIVPGFVDTHAHLRARDQLHRTDVWPYLANLAWGVTTTRDPQTGNTEVLSYADMVRAGAVLGPRVYSTGPGVFWQDGIDTEEEAMTAMKRYAEYFDTKTIKMYVSAARKGRQHIIEAARKYNIMPTTEGSLNIKQNLTETVDGYPGLEHSLPIFPVYGDYLKLFVETQRVYTPTLLVSYGGPWAENYFYSRENPHDDEKLRRFTPHDEVDSRTRRRDQWFSDEEHVFYKHAVFVKDLVEAGGLAGVGSHGQLQGLGYHWELWAMAAGGLSNHDALRVATIQGAKGLGLAGDLGSIEVGKLADLVVLDRNPLDDIRHTNTPTHVMMNGRLFEAETLDEVWPRQKTLAPLWWWDDEPTNVPGMND